MSERRFFPDNARAIVLPRLLLILSLCLFCATRTPSQEPKETQDGPGEDEVVKVRSNLVNVEVMVKDKKGKQITDLKAEDFTVLENGVRQKVEFFEPPIASSGNMTEQSSSDAQGAQAPTPAEARTPAQAPRNVISLLLDGQTTELANLKQVREGIIKYIREQIGDTDMVALFSVTNELRLLQTFTQDKAKLISAVENAYSGSSKNFEQRDIAANIDRLRGELTSTGGVTTSTVASGSTGARAMIAQRALQQYIKLRSVLSVQQSRPILAALAAICEAQRDLHAKKTLVLFSQGFVTPAVLDWQVQSAIDIANRANVAIYVIDSAGLKASAPASGAFVPASPLEGVSALSGQEQRIQAVGGETVFDYVRQEGPNRGYDILYRISGDTGGQFIKNTNDIEKGLNRIDQEIRSRYTLAYQSTDPNFDGSFRKLKVEVNRPGAQVSSRKGYFAIARDEIISLSPEDKRLLASINTGNADPQLPLFAELTPFRFQDGNYIVPLSIEVPPGALKFDRKDGKQLMQLDILGVVRETQDKILSRLGGSFDVGLTPEQFKSIQNNNIFYRQDIELAPGSYSIDLIVRDRISGKTTAKREKLDLPVADSELSFSAIVLSRHVEPAPKQPASGAPGDVLSQGGVQIRPSPSREFNTRDNLIIFFELYNAALRAETGKPSVKITLRLIKDSKAMVKPISYELTEISSEPTPHLTFAKYVSLEGLPEGRYAAKIEARDTVTGKLIEQQSAFVIVR